MATEVFVSGKNWRMIFLVSMDKFIQRDVSRRFFDNQSSCVLET